VVCVRLLLHPKVSLDKTQVSQDRAWGVTTRNDRRGRDWECQKVGERVRHGLEVTRPASYIDH